MSMYEYVCLCVTMNYYVIISSLCVPCNPPADIITPCAPRIKNSLHRVKWANKKWSSPGSEVSVSIFLELTNEVLSNAASNTNKSVSLNQRPGTKNLKTAKEIMIARQQLRNTHRLLKSAKLGNDELSVNKAKADFKAARKTLRCITRTSNHKADLESEVILNLQIWKIQKLA